MKVCLLPSVFAIFICLILNIAMLIIIYKKQGFKQNPLPVNIGKSNAAFSIILLVRGFTANSGKTMSLPLECVLVSLVLASSFSQLLANIALAIDRYLATSFPLMYRQYTSWKLWKKPLLIGETICLMVAGMLGPISLGNKSGCNLATRSNTVIGISLL